MGRKFWPLISGDSARLLNPSGYRGGPGNTWTQRRVASLWNHHGITVLTHHTAEARSLIRSVGVLRLPGAPRLGYHLRGSRNRFRLLSGCMQTYAWKRFWSPRTATINLSDGGFLVDPDTDWGRAINADLIPFSRTTDDPCLVLLGEPGIGKSFAIETARRELWESLNPREAGVVFLDLKPYGDEARLIQDLFHSESWGRWATGGHLLYLFLDSLDECRLRISNVTALLAAEFKKHPVDRLRLRIACRTAEWPVSFEAEIKEIYGAERVRALELAPLRHVDVIQALQANSIDADRFMSELNRLDAVPFAIKPITLNFLVNVYRRGGQLPSTSHELYLQGCRLLCEEFDAARRELSRATRLSADQRLALAARIAAVTVFSNRYAVWTAIDAGNVPPEDVTVEAMVGGQEGTGGHLVDVTDAAIREALATGLFSSRGPNRLGWSHATYAEFLAAHYVTQRGLSLPQLLGLTVHPDDPDGKFVPQLHEVAAWIAGVSPDFFQEVMRREPEVLLRSDVAAADEGDRSKLVEELLRLADQGLFVDRDWGLRERYRRLSHPRLADQLRHYIRDRDKHIVARRVAIDIAEACRLTELQDLLADVTLDETDLLTVRENAAAAVRKIADPSVKLRLKPLIAGSEPNSDDQLRGIALSALWPEQLSAEELFAALTPPRNYGIIGTYQHFVSDEVASRLAPSDLPVALGWVAKQPARHTMAFGFDELVTKLLLAGWAQIDAPGVLEAFAKAAFSRLKHHEGLFDTRNNRPSAMSELLDDTAKRHRLVAALVRLLALSPLSLDPVKAGVFIGSSWRLVSPADFRWIEERFRSATGGEREIWPEIIRYAVSWDDRRALRRLVRLRRHSTRLRATFPILTLLLAAYFPPGFRLFRWWRSWSWQRDLPKPKPLKPPPQIRVARLLRRCESGESAAWWLLTRELTLEPTSTHYKELESDLTALPGWKAASQETRQRIVRAAERYLLEHNAETAKWLGQRVIYRPAVAGYAALRLLQREVPNTFRVLSPAVWSNWASIILAYPGSVAPPDAELVQVALRNAPDPLIETLTALIDVENQDDGRLHVLDRLGDAWTPALAAALAPKLSDPALHIRALGRLLDILLEHNVPEARTFAASLVAQSSQNSQAHSERIITTGRALLCHASDGGWEIIWPRFQQDPVFGEGVISAVVESHPAKDLVSQHLTEEQLGRLYVWLARRYPHSEDPRVAGMHTVGRREQIAHWRDGILSYLRLRGTRAAYEALQEIQRALPELTWLTWTIIEARDLLRRREWAPPLPEHIVRLAMEPSRRLVQSGQNLLDVLVESMNRLQQDLHGETPTVQFLWNTWRDGGVKQRPKEENALSDFIKSHLERDLKERGVIVNREVEIRRRIGTSPGERTDIHVDAILPGGTTETYDTISAIIETKGSWNPEVRTAMSTQLVDRYLHENRCRFGLYVVGWFNCPAWDAEDDRRRQADTWTQSEARAHFESQATSLSTGGILVRSFVLDATLP